MSRVANFAHFKIYKRNTQYHPQFFYHSEVYGTKRANGYRLGPTTPPRRAAGPPAPVHHDDTHSAPAPAPAPGPGPAKPAPAPDPANAAPANDGDANTIAGPAYEDDEVTHADDAAEVQTAPADMPAAPANLPAAKLALAPNVINKLHNLAVGAEERLTTNSLRAYSKALRAIEINCYDVDEEDLHTPGKGGLNLIDLLNLLGSVYIPNDEKMLIGQRAQLQLRLFKYLLPGAFKAADDK